MYINVKKYLVNSIFFINIVFLLHVSATLLVILSEVITNDENYKIRFNNAMYCQNLVTDICALVHKRLKYL